MYACQLSPLVRNIKRKNIKNKKNSDSNHETHKPVNCRIGSREGGYGSRRQMKILLLGEPPSIPVLSA